MGLVNTMENAVLDALLGAGASLLPGTLYLGVMTAAPNDDGTGVVEPSGGSYARIAITNDGTSFAAAVGGAKSNLNVLTFPAATASWGVITHIGLFDAASAGNLQLFGELDTPRTVLSGDTLRFLAGTLNFTAD